MKRFFYFLLALLVPWFVFVMNDQWGKALIAMMLQASIIGWVFATPWAWRVIQEDFLAPKREEEIEPTDE